MRKNKKLSLFSSILATTAITVVPTISIVNNINTVNGSQLDNLVQNNEQVEVDSFDSDIVPLEGSKQVKDTEVTFTVDAEALETAGWGTNITGSLVFIVINDMERNVSVKAGDRRFAATNFKIQSTIINAGITYNVTTIDGRAFKGCSNLTGTLTIPSSVTTIDEWAFADCIGLIGNLTIPANVTSIGDYAFEDCNFTSIDIALGNKVFSKAKNLGPCQAIIDNTSAIFSDNSKVVGSLACGNLVLPSDIKTIGEMAFVGCAGLTGSLIIPASVTTIGDSAFAHCSSLMGNLLIPSSVTSIGNSAFASCTDLTSITVTTGVITIGDYAFEHCFGLTGDLTIPSSVTSIGIYAFRKCIGLNGTLTIPSSVTSIGDNTFEGCAGLIGSLTIPDSITTIGDDAFINCSSLNGVTIPASVTTIGDGAFAYCSGLTSLDLSNAKNLETIGESAFEWCTSITSLDLSNATSLTTIDRMSFQNCSSLTDHLTIPRSVTSIGGSAFAFTGLKDVKFLSGTLPLNLGNYAFGMSNSIIIINVPKGAKDVWVATPNIMMKLGIVSSEQIKEFTPPTPTGSITLSGSQGNDKIIAGKGGNIAITAAIGGTLTPRSLMWDIKIDPDAPTEKLDGITVMNKTDSGCKVNVDATVVAATYHVILAVGGEVNGIWTNSGPLKLTIIIDPVTPDPRPTSGFPWWIILVIIGATSVIVSSLTITIVTINRKNNDK